MSLFGAIQLSSNALRVGQLGLQVVGNNISNANTPGYIRQELVQAPAAGYRLGDSIVGQGVVSVGVKQQIDTFVAIVCVTRKANLRTMKPSMRDCNNCKTPSTRWEKTIFLLR